MVEIKQKRPYRSSVKPEDKALRIGVSISPSDKLWAKNNRVNMSKLLRQSLAFLRTQK